MHTFIFADNTVIFNFSDGSVYFLDTPLFSTYLNVLMTFFKTGHNDSILQGPFRSALLMAMVKVIIKVFNDSPQETIIIRGVIH